MSSNREVAHVCLVGPLVTDDWELIRSLRSRYLVTLVERVDYLSRPSNLAKTQLMVMDCSQSGDNVLDGLPGLKREFSDLDLLLVDGGLSQKQIAQAFEDGVKDYFSAPYPVDLLIERIDSLCSIRSSNQFAFERVTLPKRGT